MEVMENFLASATVVDELSVCSRKMLKAGSHKVPAPVEDLFDFKTAKRWSGEVVRARAWWLF